MENLKYQLALKYGLPEFPTNDQVEIWIALTEENIRKNIEREEAGEIAAKEAFPECGRMIYDSVADTIESLLLAVRQKHQESRKK